MKNSQRYGMLREEEALTEEPRISFEALREDASRVIVPRRGSMFDEDGAVKIAIIRPCVSRGRAIGGKRPIYTPQMLEANAKTFTGWVMFADHLVEGLAEGQDLEEERNAWLAEAARRSRSINELGGRIIESWWDPSFKHPEDEAYGHRPGAVLGRAIPQPQIRAMLEADPEILRVSINAFPKGARPGVAPWDSSLRGMLIEGILNEPPGSVDWVIRAGAGGRVLREDEDRAVCLLEGFYDPPHADATRDNEVETMDFDKMSDAEIAAAVAARPALKAALTESLAPAPAATPALSEEKLAEIISGAVTETAETLRSEFRETLAERDAEAEERAETLLRERDEARVLQDLAHQLIESADLPEEWQGDLKRRYSVLPSGPSPALLQESDEELSAEDKIRALVEADVTHANKLISAIKPGPVVEGQGGAGGGEQPAKKIFKPGENDFVDWLTESGGFKDPAEAITTMREAVQG